LFELRRAEEERERLLILDLRDPAVLDEQAVETPALNGLRVGREVGLHRDIDPNHPRR